MVIKEAMRLYPPAYAFGRIATASDRIFGYDLPAGAVMIASPWATHRHPDFWSEPEAFDPERFAPEAVAARHKYAYIPFAAGPRTCVGNHFAMIEAVVAVAVLLRAYALRTDAGRVPLTTAITLRPAGPVPCEVTARRSPGAG
jgi:cytochrome P450